MRIVKLDDADQRFSIDPASGGMLASETALFVAPFERHLIDAFSSIKGYEKKPYSLFAGVRVLVANENGYLNRGYGPSIHDAMEGKWYVGPMVCIWLRWSVLDSFAESGNRSAKLALLPEFNMTEVFEEYERLCHTYANSDDFDELIIRALQQYIWGTVQRGVRRCVERLDHAISDRFAEIRKREETRAALLNFHDPWKG